MRTTIHGWFATNPARFSSGAGRSPLVEVQAGASWLGQADGRSQDLALQPLVSFGRSSRDAGIRALDLVVHMPPVDQLPMTFEHAEQIIRAVLDTFRRLEFSVSEHVVIHGPLRPKHPGEPVIYA